MSDKHELIEEAEEAIIEAYTTLNKVGLDKERDKVGKLARDILTTMAVPDPAPQSEGVTQEQRIAGRSQAMEWIVQASFRYQRAGELEGAQTVTAVGVAIALMAYE